VDALIVFEGDRERARRGAEQMQMAGFDLEAGLDNRNSDAHGLTMDEERERDALAAALLRAQQTAQRVALAH
jgi:hypothetical protein